MGQCQGPHPSSPSVKFMDRIPIPCFSRLSMETPTEVPGGYRGAGAEMAETGLLVGGPKAGPLTHPL